jgi:hypothetical protein
MNRNKACLSPDQNNECLSDECHSSISEIGAQNANYSYKFSLYSCLDDDEFFDANDTFTEKKSSRQPDGVSHCLEQGPSTCLLNFPDKTIAVPITQVRIFEI